MRQKPVIVDVFAMEKDVVALLAAEFPRFGNSRKVEMKCRSSELRRPDLARLLFALFRSRHFVVVQRLKLIDHGLNELGGEAGEP